MTCDWSEVPHLTAQAKADLEASIPAYQRAARTQGIPALGAGAVFPIPEADIRVPGFQIPKHWPRGYGLDVGFIHGTAAVWVAHDRDADTRYIYDCYKRLEAEPVVHVAAIKARGDWIPGRIDPAAGASGQLDGQRLLEKYQELGLLIGRADNAVEAGLFEMLNLFSTGRLKVFASCGAFFQEFRLYHRDERGRIVKKNDDVIDAARYVIQSGIDWLKTAPPHLRPGAPRTAFTGPPPQRRGWSA